LHEFSFTSRIGERGLQEAEKHHAKRVVEVHLVIGKLTFLNPEQVRFAFEVLTKGTILEGSRLLIEEREGWVRCPQCGYEGRLNCQDNPIYHLLAPTLRCPRCGGIVEIMEGRECLIKRVRLAV